jgi:hypothetical protein
VEGEVRDLTASVSVAPGTGTWRFTVLLNGVDFMLSCDITGLDRSCTDNTAPTSATVDPGDLFTVRVEPINSPTAPARVAFAVIMEPTAP